MSIVRSILNFFVTAPKVKSEKVYQLEKAGKADLIIEAVKSERAGTKKDFGKSKSGEVTVKRVGVAAHG